MDIPNTVANAVAQAGRLKVKMLTLHISGGKEMLEAAVKAAKEASLAIKLKASTFNWGYGLDQSGVRPG